MDNYPSNLYFFANEELSTDKSFLEKIKSKKFKKVGNHTFYFK